CRSSSWVTVPEGSPVCRSHRSSSLDGARPCDSPPFHFPTAVTLDELDLLRCLMHMVDDPVTRRAFLTIGGLGALGLRVVEDAAAQVHVSKETEQMNARIVTEFCEAFAKRDVAKATSLLAEKCTYRPSQTAPPVTGRDAVAERVKRMM